MFWIPMAEAARSMTDKEKEFEVLVDQFGRFIRLSIHKFNIQKFGLDPEDIAQEVKIKIWRLLNHEKSIGNYASYIKKIVNSSVIDQLRRLRREEGILLHEKRKKIAEHDRIYSPGSPLHRNIKEIVGQAVESLIESRKKAVKLYLLGMNIEEISSYLNWSQDKTRNLLYRGLSDLKNILKVEGIEYEDR